MKAIEFASTSQKDQLQHLFSIQPSDTKDKIILVKEIFDQSGASKANQKAIQDYTFKAFEILDNMNIGIDKKVVLKSFGEKLMNRSV